MPEPRAASADLRKWPAPRPNPVKGSPARRPGSRVMALVRCLVPILQHVAPKAPGASSVRRCRSDRIQVAATARIQSEVMLARVRGGFPSSIAPRVRPARSSAPRSTRPRLTPGATRRTAAFAKISSPASGMPIVRRARTVVAGRPPWGRVISRARTTRVSATAIAPATCRARAELKLRIRRRIAVLLRATVVSTQTAARAATARRASRTACACVRAPHSVIRTPVAHARRASAHAVTAAGTATSVIPERTPASTIATAAPVTRATTIRSLASGVAPTACQYPEPIVGPNRVRARPSF
jgi:hypothetical protein